MARGIANEVEDHGAALDRFHPGRARTAPSGDSPAAIPCRRRTALSLTLSSSATDTMSELMDEKTRNLF